MSRFVIIVSIAFVFSLAGCKPDDIGDKTSWQELQLTGKTLELINPSIVEGYHFGNDGVVAGTYGRKDGDVTAPALYWKIENNNLLISEDSQFKDAEIISPPYLNKNIVTINRNFLWWDRFRISNN